MCDCDLEGRKIPNWLVETMMIMIMKVLETILFIKWRWQIFWVWLWWYEQGPKKHDNLPWVLNSSNFEFFADTKKFSKYFFHITCFQLLSFPETRTILQVVIFRRRCFQIGWTARKLVLLFLQPMMMMMIWNLELISSFCKLSNVCH